MAYKNIKKDDDYEVYEEKPVAYDIPSNFVAEATILWGMFKMRRAIEAGVIMGTFLFFVFNFVHSLKAGLILIIVCAVPLAFLALMGLNDGPLSEFIVDFFRHLKRKKIITFDEKIFGNKEVNQDTNNKNIKEGDKKL